LNITAKFSFIILVQKMNMKYRNEQAALKAAFEEDGQSKAKKGVALKDAAKSSGNDGVSLKELVKETLAFAGMEHQVQLLMKRLEQVFVKTCSDLDDLTEQVCKDKSLPWELVRVCQLRLSCRSEKMEEMKKEQATKQLLHSMISTDPAQVEKAISTAKDARIGQDLLKKAEARVIELNRSMAMQKYLEGHLKELFDSKDQMAVQKGIDLAKALGMEDLDKQGKEQLDTLKKEEKAAAQLFKKGLDEMKAKKFEEPLKHFDEARVMQPSNVKVLINRCAALQNLKRWEILKLAASEVTTLYPSNGKARGLLAVSLLELGEPRKAVEECEAALRLDENNATALQVKAKAESSLRHEFEV